MTLHSPEQAAFDEFVMRFDDDIPIPLAQALADAIGVNFDPLNYDH
jgi:hypothetical protein